MMFTKVGSNVDAKLCGGGFHERLLLGLDDVREGGIAGLVQAEICTDDGLRASEQGVQH